MHRPFATGELLSLPATSPLAKLSNMDSPHPLKVWIDKHTTQAQFARDVECSDGYLTEVLNGKKRNLSLDMARRFSKATGGKVSLDDLADQLEQAG